jgi:hypothetical protein
MFVEYDAVAPDEPSGPANFSTDTANITYYSTWAPNAEEYVWELTPEDVGVVVDGDTITEVKIYWSNDPDYTAELKVKTVNTCGESDFSEPLTIHVNWTVKVEEAAEGKPYSIYPNPSDEFLRVRFENTSDDVRLEAYNAQGRLMASPVPADDLVQFRTEEWAPGIYYLVIQLNGKSYCEKVIVR